MKKITLLFVCLISTFTFAQPGTIDFSFNTGSGPDAKVYATLTLPDGKILIGGLFHSYNGVTRNGIARLNTDGSLDTTFDPGTGLALATEYVYCMTRQSDGKIMIGGNFANYNGTARKNIARINADGSLDTTFNSGTGFNADALTISLQSTGKIIVGGLFTSYNAVAKNRIVRLNADGSIDGTFVMGTGANSYVWTSSVLPDDRIYIGGGFSVYNSATANHIIRLNADGTRDSSFTSTRLTNNSVLTHVVQPDGKILIGGYFTTYGAVTRNRFARINFDGTLDTSFNPGTALNTATEFPLTIVLQPNGKILLGGGFTTFNGTQANRIIRLNSDATIDTSFLSGIGMNGIVYWATFQPDGKILVASEATSYNGDTTRPNLVRINAYDDNSTAITSFSVAAPYCTEQAFTVNYTAPGYYLPANVFTAQLSDASGSFAAPVNIGSVNAVADGSINATIPTATIAGSGYRIRVVSSLNPGTPADNGANLTIAVPVTYYADTDNDGYGNAAAPQVFCTVIPAGFTLDNTDCDDTDPNSNPAAVEVPFDGIDNNCNGNLDESYMTTSLLPTSCNSTLASVGSLIGITTVSTHYITKYRIRLTNGAQVQTIEKSVPHFMVTEFPAYDYATTYTVDIELQRNGIWQGYGPTCQVSTPAILADGGAAQVSESQCGLTLAKINTLIATTSLPGVTAYRFKVTNLTDPLGPNAIQTIERTPNWFSLPMLARYNYGTTYRIEIAVKTSTSAFGGYGSPCEVSSPQVPTLINCGGTVANMTTIVAATSLSGVSQYRFQITRQSDNASATIDKNVNYFTFSNVPAPVFSAGEIYYVRVAVMTGGTFSPLGDLCEITAPGVAARPAMKTAQEIAPALSVTAAPNPFVSGFAINLTSENPDNIQLKVYDMLGRLVDSKELKPTELDLQIGAQYPSGVYNVIVSQGDIVKTLRVVKR